MKDTSWKPVYGERGTIRDQFNQVDIGFEKAGSPDYGLHMIFRVYNAVWPFDTTFPNIPAACITAWRPKIVNLRFLRRPKPGMRPGRKAVFGFAVIRLA